MNKDGKPVQGQVTCTYVADNGSIQNGNTYTFAPTAERASIENKGVTYLYKLVDPAAYTAGQGGIKGYSIDANGQIKDLVIKVIYTKKNPAQPTRPQTSVPAPTDPQPTSVQPTIPNPAPQPTQDQPTNLQFIEDQPIIPVPQPEVIPLPAIKTQIKQYNYSNVPHSEILQTHKQNATVMPHAQKKIISHVQSVRPQAEILPSGKIKTLKGELLGHVNKKGQVLNAKGEVIGHLKQMNASVLPQTGEKQDNIWAIVLGSLAAGSSIIVLAYDRRKKQE